MLQNRNLSFSVLLNMIKTTGVAANLIMGLTLHSNIHQTPQITSGSHLPTWNELD